MKKIFYLFKVVFLISFFTTSITAQNSESIKLLKPETKGGLPIMETLKKRESSRSYSPKMLEDQVLSNLLWAAFGINRISGKRTAPSYGNVQEIDIYLIMEKGL